MDTNFCGQCGTRLKGSARVRGACPRCLMRLGLETGVLPTGGETVAVPTVEEISAELPQYEILERIGRGGMGAVYRARQKSLERVVALKVLLPTLGRDPSFAGRFLREAQALAGLRHPGIVDVYDFGQAGDYSYFAMEFVDGANLREVMREGRLPVAQALGMVGQVCEALESAHQQDVVHRDIKPENILVDSAGAVKVTDFGLAKLTAQDGPSLLTRTDQIMGTVHYMAPEQVERPQEVDRRADLYSVGVLLYELLTGELPIGRFPPPSHLSGVDARLDGVVLRALEKSPDHRYQSALELGHELERIVSTPASATPPRRPPPPPPRAVMHPMCFAPRKTGNRLAKTIRVAVAVMCVVFGLVAVSSVFLFNARSERVSSEAALADKVAFDLAVAHKRQKTLEHLAGLKSVEDGNIILDERFLLGLQITSEQVAQASHALSGLHREYVALEQSNVVTKPWQGGLLVEVKAFPSERRKLVERVDHALQSTLGCDGRDRLVRAHVADRLMPWGGAEFTAHLSPWGDSARSTTNVQSSDGQTTVHLGEQRPLSRSMERIWEREKGSIVAPKSSVRAEVAYEPEPSSSRVSSFPWILVVVAMAGGLVLIVGLTLAGVLAVRHRRLESAH